jgi:hypothetical protein
VIKVYQLLADGRWFYPAFSYVYVFSGLKFIIKHSNISAISWRPVLVVEKAG